MHIRIGAYKSFWIQCLDNSKNKYKHLLLFALLVDKNVQNVFSSYVMPCAEQRTVGFKEYGTQEEISLVSENRVILKISSFQVSSC